MGSDPQSQLIPNLGGHHYPGCEEENNFFTSDCAFGCGCWMGGSRSGGPDGVDPFGACPSHPVQVIPPRARRSEAMDETKALEEELGVVRPPFQPHQNADDALATLQSRVLALDRELANSKGALKVAATHNLELQEENDQYIARITQLKKESDERAQAIRDVVQPLGISAWAPLDAVHFIAKELIKEREENARLKTQIQENEALKARNAELAAIFDRILEELTPERRMDSATPTAVRLHQVMDVNVEELGHTVLAEIKARIVRLNLRG